MLTFLQDCRFAIRHLAKSPVFTLTTVLSLAIGIGVNTAIFSSMDAVVLRPLVVPRLDEVVTLSEQRSNGSDEDAALANYQDWQNNSRSFEELAVRQSNRMTLTGSGDAERIEAISASSNFFHTLRATPLIGRVYSADEAVPGHAAVAVLNYGFWQQRLAADPNVLGRRIELDQHPYVIIGVMPKTMQYPSNADVYLPLSPTAADRADRKAHSYRVIGRLRPGVTVPQAQAEMRTLAQHLAASYPASNQGWSVHVEPLLDGINGPYTPAYYKMLLGGTLFVLLVVCANVANLQLARGIGRKPEIAIRTALGATRFRILRQLVTENIVLALAGAAGGVAFASLFLRMTLVFMPERVAHLVAGWSNIHLNSRALAFSLLLACVAGLAAGLTPAFEALRVNVADQVKAGARGAIGSKRTHYLRNLFAIAQISLAASLVIGAALISKGLNLWFHVADAYHPNQTLTFNVALPASRYQTPQQRTAFYTASLDRLRLLPGVTDAELTTDLPFNDNGWVREVEVQGHPAAPGGFQSAYYLPVSPGYFAALHIPLKAGRIFSKNDATEAEPVAIVSERFVNQYFPKESPLGHKIHIGGSNSQDPWRTIVGVAKETEYSLWDPVPHPAAYVDALQSPPDQMQYLVTTGSDPATLVRSVHAALASLDSSLPLNEMETYAQRQNDNLIGLMYASGMLGFDALFALFLAAIGIFAVMTNLVRERTREIGVRIALGAEKEAVQKMILTGAGKLIFSGLAGGLLLAFGMAYGLRGLLQGVQPHDPFVFVTVSSVIALVAFLSSWLPAKRATEIEPMVALREE